MRLQQLEEGRSLDELLEEVQSIVPARMLGEGLTAGVIKPERREEVMSGLRKAAEEEELQRLTASQLMERYVLQVQGCSYYKVNAILQQLHATDHLVWLGITDTECRFHAVGSSKVSSLQAHKLIQIYTNTDYCLVAFCT
jgi:hypothetical protein